MVSILDNNALDDFIDSAEMEGNNFEVKRVHQNHSFLMEATTHRSIQTLNFSAFDHEQLSIPRKPAWNKKMTAEEVDRNEKNAFLRWRREIASIEALDDYTKKVTPFEKNLEVWRQLWRVCERSELLIQIVDARNPLLYYTKDLMRYVTELQPPRKMILLINKADFLTEYQRLLWAQYFTALGVRFAFYSAHIAQAKLDAMGVDDELLQELSAVDEQEVRWLGTDIAASFVAQAEAQAKADAAAAAAAAKTKTKTKRTTTTATPVVASGAVETPAEGTTNSNTEILFDPASLAQYEAGEQQQAEEEAAATAAARMAHAQRPQTIPEDEEEEEEESEDEEEDEEEEESEEESEGEGAVSSSKLQVEKDAVEEEEAEEEDDDEEAIVKFAASRRAETSAVAAEEEEEEEEEDDEEEEVEETVAAQEQPATVSDNTQKQSSSTSSASLDRRRARLLNREELIFLLETVSDALALEPQEKNDGRVCIGLVGYPNVGKSSVINSLLGVSKSSHGTFSLLHRVLVWSF
jgi:ribosome biogenesis GTPase A